MSSRPEPVVPTPQTRMRSPRIWVIVRSHHLDRAAVGPDIDLVQDVSFRIENDQVRADRPDVDAKVRLHLRAGRGEARRADSIAQE
jgi:hypothetical protein